MIFTAQVIVINRNYRKGEFEGYVHSFEAKDFNDAFNSKGVQNAISYYQGRKIEVLLLKYEGDKCIATQRHI